MKKVIALLLAFVLVIGATVAGTLAYLTSTTETVVNTFTVGNVNITLDEAHVDANGNVVDETRVLANTYKLMPGHTYTKDPTVHVQAGSEDCYVRMFVTIENWATLASKLPEGALPQDLCKWNDAYWTCESYKTVNNDAVLEFRHNAIVEESATATDLPALFESITLPGTVTDVTGLDTVKINVIAEAIQADGFATPAAAFEALNEA